MSHYLFSVMHDYVNNPPIPDPTKDVEMYARVGAFNESIAEKIVFAGGLEAPSTATVVQERDGQLLISDGPYAETKDMVGGFWVIEATDLDEAIGLAQRATVACGVPVEVRPFQSDS